MRNARAARLGLLSLICLGSWSVLIPGATAAVQVATYDHLVAAQTVLTPLGIGDTLFSNLFTTEVGGPNALNQVTTFTVGAGVGSFVGRATWEAAPPPEPNLSGVEIKIFQGATLIADDTFQGVSFGFARSTFDPETPIAPGTYTLVATGNSNRAGSLDISLTFADAVPEAGTFSMLIAGLGALGFLARRRLMM